MIVRSKRISLLNAARQSRSHLFPPSKSLLFTATRTSSLLAKLAAHNEEESPVLLKTYLAVAATLVGSVALFKMRTKKDYGAELFWEAQSNIIKNPQILEKIGSPMHVERMKNSQDQCITQTLEQNKITGSILATGPRGSVVVRYSGFETSPDSDKFVLEKVHVDLEDESSLNLSILPKINHDESLTDENINNDSDRPWLTFLASVVVGTTFGCTLAFLIIRILKGRGSHLYKTALDMTEKHPEVIRLLGTPLNSTRKDYKGSINDSIARFEVVCRGPNGEGTVKAHALRGPSLKNTEVEDDDWKFTTLSIDIHGKRTTIDILKNIDEKPEVNINRKKGKPKVSKKD